MPSSLVGALVFLALLTPGFCYLLRHERGRRPGRRVSPFRETVSLIFASAWSLLVALGLFAAVRAIAPASTPDVGKLVRSPHDYAVAHYQLVTWWALGVLLVACIFAFSVALVELPERLQKTFDSPEGVNLESAWWTLFERPDAQDRYKRVTCHLIDGAVLEGTLYLYNPSVEETDERDLALGGPFYIEERDGTRRRFDEGALVVPGRQVSWLHVDYLTDTEHAELTNRPLEEWRRRTSAGAPMRANERRLSGLLRWFFT